MKASIRSDSNIVKIPHLKLTAKMYFIDVNYKGLFLRVPEISAFILHKILVQPLRNNEAKKEKDAETICSLSDLIVERLEIALRMRQIYAQFNKKWKNKIMDESKQKYPNIAEILAE